ncbi:hypothetical protein [Henriciella sp.]|uniref:hypothetical protein n=1 Tax=Henriciella sp. TaxID=1968823 RepID=UPI0026089533|nr:hypothetical protein [Henriciella sp.]
MIRFCFLSVLLMAACTSNDASPPYYVPYDGYGQGMETVSATYDVQRQTGNTSIDISSIGSALDEFLSPAGDSLILLPNRLDKSKLDYSLESLSEVDEWLRDIHTINKLQADEGRAGESLISDGRGDNSVMFAGLYLGEVIRMNSNLGWQWQRFDRFIANNPYFTEHYGYEPGFDSFVLVGPQGVATPINTALKRVLLGKEESLRFIGDLLVEPIDLDAATSGYNFYGLDEIR